MRAGRPAARLRLPNLKRSPHHIAKMKQAALADLPPLARK
jgi:hypothetical protein